MASATRTAKGRVDVAREFCKGCGLCVAVCPKKVLRIADRVNSRGYRPTEQATDDCVACGLCTMTCPDAVLTVYRIVEE